MKQKDILLVIVVVILSGVVSLFISKYLFSIPASRHTQVEVVQPISSNFDQPDSRYFNSNSIDPTKNITIGNSQNPQPFSSSNGQ